LSFRLFLFCFSGQIGFSVCFFVYPAPTCGMLHAISPFSNPFLGIRRFETESTETYSKNQFPAEIISSFHQLVCMADDLGCQFPRFALTNGIIDGIGKASKNAADDACNKAGAYTEDRILLP